MATVTVAFTPLPAHVRTARFISASVARRAGVAESILDEVRLAVSEACSLAVRLHRAHAPRTPVELRLTDEADAFRVEVADAVARQGPGDDGAGLAIDGDGDAAASTAGALEAVVGPDDGSGDIADLQARERIGLAVIAGLVDDFKVDYRETGSVVTMSWPLAAEASAGRQDSGAQLF